MEAGALDDAIMLVGRKGPTPTEDRSRRRGRIPAIHTMRLAPPAFPSASLPASTDSKLPMQRPLRLLSLVCLPLLVSACATPPATTDAKSENAAIAPVPADPYLWLEDVHAERSLTWARAHNAKSTGELVDGEFHGLEAKLRAILDSEEKIPYVTKIGALYYNLWQDARK